MALEGPPDSGARTTEYKSLRLWAEIFGLKYELLSFDCNFGVNRIAEGQATVAVGRNAKTSRPAAIHQLGSLSFPYLTPIKIWLQVQAQSGPDPWGSEPFVVFEGVLTGVSPILSLGSARVGLFMASWPVELAYSSMLASSVGANAPSYISSGVMDRLGSDAGAQNTARGRMSYTGLSLASDLREDFLSDIWSGLQGYMESVARTPTLLVSENNPELESQINDKNESAIEALNRLTTYEGYPLAMNAVQERAVLNGVINYVGNFSTRQMMETSFWDKLVGVYAPSFMFSIVPQAEKTYIVPLLPGCRQIYQEDGKDKTIYAREYKQISANLTITKPVKSVILGAVNTSYVGAGSLRERPLTTQGGIFKPSNSKTITNGIIRFANPPPWLSEAIRLGAFGTTHLQTEDQKPTRSPSAPKGSGSKPDVSDAGKAGQTPKQVIGSVDRILQLFAKSIYVQEMLKPKVASISGKLRFDIAPGSTVRIQGLSDPFIPNDAVFGVERVALVSAISYTYNAAQRKAGTAFRLTHVRSEAENEDDDFTSAEHPLYEKPWAGMPMLERF